MRLVDRHGKLVEVDGDVVPDGCKVSVLLTLMDRDRLSDFNPNHAGDPTEEDEGMKDRYPISDAMRLHAQDSYLDMKDRVGAGMRRHRVPTPDDEVADGADYDPRQRAYDAMKKRLSTPKARKPKPPPGGWGQEWQR